MTKLSKEKRNQLVLIAIATVGVMGGVWWFVIAFQQSKLKEVARKTDSVQKEIDKTKKVVSEASQVETELKEANGRLAVIEETMPSGDLYAQLVSRFKQFNAASYRVDIPQYGLPVVGEVSLLPGFPYHQATVNVTGTAYYWDLGKFIAEFENRFPYSRIQNLGLEPSGNTSSPEEREKLTFHMDIVTLVKSS
jgi:Tfp pilus assembly protein PilO